MTTQSKRDRDNVDKRGIPHKKYRRQRLREIMAILSKHEIVKGITPVKLRKIVEDLGPTFVKFGQVLSMRQDILPAAYCHELEKLREDVNPLPFEVIKAQIEREYDRKIRDVFETLDPIPLGSASIAQVHRGTLLDGTAVVAKVQRPGIYETMSEDMALLYRATSLLKRSGAAGDAIDFSMVLDEMWVTAKQEMDFLMEANNAETFAENNKGIVYVTSPHIYHSFTTSKVLVMEYIHGEDISNTQALTDAGYDLAEIGNKLCENYIKQIVDDAFFHADPHPGNIRIQDGKIAWIDLGMMGTLSTRDKNLYKEVIQAMASKNVEKMKTVVLTMGVHHGHINHARLYADIDDMLEEYASLDLGSMNIGLILEETLRIANYHHIAMPKGMTMLARGIMTLEGVVEMLDPDINVVQIMMNHVQAHSFSDFNPQKEASELAHSLYSAQKNVLELPRYASDFFKMVLRGQAKVNLEITGSEEPLDRIDQMVNRIVVALITASLLMGSSFISTTNMTPKLLGIPALGALGYFVAICLGTHMVFDIYRTKWRRRKKNQP